MVWIGLEGCDGTGKSSLAEAVKTELERRVRIGLVPPGEVELIHRGPPERSVLEEYATDVEFDDRHLVFDRWHMGTLVYAQIYRATGPFGELGVGGFRWVEKFLQARGARFFVIDQPYDVVKARLEARGEDYLQSHHVEQVLERFREVAGMSILTNGTTFQPREGEEFIVDDARSLLDDAQLYAGHVNDFRSYPSYVGGNAPKVLLVGEKRGGQPPFASEACFMPLKNKSGEYLWECLPDPFWRTVGVVNAREDEVSSLMKRFVNEPQVVALGREASKALSASGIKHAGVPHPQHVKRFNHSLQQQYGELIATVATSQEQVFTWPN